MLAYLSPFVLYCPLQISAIHLGYHQKQMSYQQSIDLPIENPISGFEDYSLPKSFEL